MDFEAELRDREKLARGIGELPALRPIPPPPGNGVDRPTVFFGPKFGYGCLIFSLGLLCVWMGQSLSFTSWIDAAVLAIPTLLVVRWLPNTIAIRRGFIVKHRWLGLRNTRIALEELSWFRVATRIELQESKATRSHLNASLFMGWIGIPIYLLLSNELVIWLPSARAGREILFTHYHSGWDRFVHELDSRGIRAWRPSMELRPPPPPPPFNTVIVSAIFAPPWWMRWIHRNWSRTRTKPREDIGDGV